MRIWFKDRYHRISGRSTLLKSQLVRLVKKVLVIMGESSAEVGIVLTGDAEIRRLNRNYRGINRPTDVLAFAFRENPFPFHGKGLNSQLLGDIVISLPTAKRQAMEQGHSPEQEVAVLIIHGLLHLMGYDHERSQTAAKTMRRKERELLRTLSDKV